MDVGQEDWQTEQREEGPFCEPRMGQAEAGRLKVQSQLELPSQTLPQCRQADEILNE